MRDEHARLVVGRDVAQADQTVPQEAMGLYNERFDVVHAVLGKRPPPAPGNLAGLSSEGKFRALGVKPECGFFFAGDEGEPTQEDPHAERGAAGEGKW